MAAQQRYVVQFSSLGFTAVHINAQRAGTDMRWRECVCREMCSNPISGGLINAQVQVDAPLAIYVHIAFMYIKQVYYAQNGFCMYTLDALI